jgi:hypothetical protein
LRDGEIEEWLSTLQVGLTPGEQTLLLEKLRTLTG